MRDAAAARVALLNAHLGGRLASTLPVVAWKPMPRLLPRPLKSSGTRGAPPARRAAPSCPRLHRPHAFATEKISHALPALVEGLRPHRHFPRPGFPAGARPPGARPDDGRVGMLPAPRHPGALSSAAATPTPPPGRPGSDKATFRQPRGACGSRSGPPRRVGWLQEYRHGNGVPNGGGPRYRAAHSSGYGTGQLPCAPSHA